MKKLLLAAACILAMVSSLAADGQVNFSNLQSGTKIFKPDGTTPLVGPDFVAQLWWSATNDEASMAAVGATQAFKTQGSGFEGLFTGKARTIPGSDGVKTFFFQIRAWEAAGGADWASASVSGKLFGKSEIFTAVPTLAPATPADLLNFTKSFNVIPEPSTIALGVLGAAALLALRRK